MLFCVFVWFHVLEFGHCVSRVFRVFACLLLLVCLVLCLCLVAFHVFDRLCLYLKFIIV